MWGGQTKEVFTLVDCCCVPGILEKRLTGKLKRKDCPRLWEGKKVLLALQPVFRSKVQL